ncbi:hypothetical protein Taro_034260 [Colocasia esculenta]|uniref:Uncharacterized protein n=1 Tax=Colocasia esculenta TaxID=4460 RepID=A0A843WBE5_COLES|nr:hypothetical protein [Colocasia esculenta]
MSRGVRRGVSSRPQHPRVPRYFLYHHLWTTTFSCKAWFRQCRPRRRLRRDCRLSSRLKLELAQAPAPVPQEHGHGGPSIMERFKRMAPPSFKGECQPLLAESWMREVEKVFQAIRCAEEDKVSLATYMLQERADVWWASVLCTSVQAGERDGPISGGEEGSLEEVSTTFPQAGQEQGSVPVTPTSSCGYESAGNYTAVTQLQAQ